MKYCICGHLETDHKKIDFKENHGSCLIKTCPCTYFEEDDGA